MWSLSPRKWAIQRDRFRELCEGGGRLGGSLSPRGGSLSPRVRRLRGRRLRGQVQGNRGSEVGPGNGACP